MITDIVLADGSTLVFMDSEGFFGKQRRSAAPQQRLAAAPHNFTNVFFILYVMQRRNVADCDATA